MSDNLREHNFDGIQEYDNQLPRWWVYKFIITIIFAAIYLYWYQLADLGGTLYDEYKGDAKRAAEEQAAQAPQTGKSEQELRAMLQDPKNLQAGSQIFMTRCLSCHGPEGQGLVGPNLTDNYWIHGGKMTDIVQTITKGVPEKGMIPWGGQLTQDEIYQVATYVKSLKGKQVSNPKKPEGVPTED